MTNRYNYAALVIAGLMSSSVAMAKNSGDVIQSGTGSVTINGSVTNTTCSASVDNATQRFVLSLQEINSANNDEELVSIHSPITLNGCNGQWMNATITAARQLDGWYGSFNEQNTDMLAYQVGF